MDSVQKVGNGHPGTAMSLAPAAYLLFQKVMRHDPADPHWPGRDRFVLSCGHSSLTLYIQLYLGGWGLELEDLKSLRTWGSKTPGHPEYGHTAGVETTTGPARPGRRPTPSAWRWPPAASTACSTPTPPRASRPSTTTSTRSASDGDLEEGVSGEASSIAGTQQLGNLDPDLRRQPDLDRGQHRHRVHRGRRRALRGLRLARPDVDWTHGGDSGLPARTSRPCTTRSSRPSASPTGRASSGSARSSAGRPPTSRTPSRPTATPSATPRWRRPRRSSASTPTRPSRSPAVIEHTRKAVERGQAARAEWQTTFDAWSRKPSADVDLYERLQTRTLPDGWDRGLPTFPADEKGLATRKASGEVINAIAPRVPELWGGSADLAESNNTTIEGAPSFIPRSRSTKLWKGDPYAGRVLHFGIREHAHGRDHERHRRSTAAPASSAARS